MHILNKITRWVCGYGLRASLFGFAILLSLVMCFGSPDKIKNAFASSGLYEIPLSQLIEAQADTGDEADIRLDDPLVQRATEEALTAERKQQAVETILDGTYLWLSGESSHPDFEIDFSDDKERFTTTLADELFEKIDSLKPCSLEQTNQLLQEGVEPLSLECKPPVDLQEQKQIFISNLRNNDEFIDDPVLSGEELLNELHRRDTTQAADKLPDTFQLFQKLPLYLAAMSVLFGVGVLLLSDSKLKGARRLGKIFLQAAISLLIVGIATYFILGGLRTSIGTQSKPQLNAALVNIFDTLRSQLLAPTFFVFLAYLIIGVLLLVFVRKKQVQDLAANTKNQPTKH